MLADSSEVVASTIADRYQPGNAKLVEEIAQALDRAYDRGVEWAQENCPTGGWASGL
jgi:hypothetical protein